MKKIYLYITICLLGLSSCSDWLDVSASDQIKESQLFEKGEGFRNALIGIYQELSTPELYGKQLSWGMIDAMSQQYDPSKLDLSAEFVFTHMMKSEYHTTYVQDAIKKVWQSMYQAIANCNNLIQNIEKTKPSLFEYKEEERDMITAEAYALRGFLHFDLLRMFAPAPATKPSGTYIPYRNVYPSTISQRLSVDETLNRIIADLEKAKQLSYRDTIPENIGALQSVGSRVGIANYFSSRGIFWSYRCTRMNFLNISAILARVYAYADKWEEAYREADYVMNFKGLNFPSKYGGYKGNPRSKDDILLAFFNVKATEYFGEYAGGDCGYWYLSNINELYQNETSDKRKSELISTINNLYISQRSIKNSDRAIERENGPLLPVLRKAEMIHIVCEYLVKKNRLDDAITTLQKLRNDRGLSSSNLNEIIKIENKVEKEKAFLQKLRLDVHKEYIGEGQIFFMYKRLNLPIWNGNNGTVTPEWVLPIPTEEQV